MNPLDLLRLVGTNLSRSRVRAGLSASGVVIGTAAIVILISLATGLQAYTTRNLSSIGPLNEINVISLGGGGGGIKGGGVFISVSSAEGGGPDPFANSPKLTPKYINSLNRRDDVAAVMVRQRLNVSSLKHKAWQSTSGSIYGVDTLAFSEFNLPMTSGDIDLGRWQVVIGSKVGESFFDPREAKGETLPAIDLQGQILTMTLSKTNDEGETTTRTVRLRVAGVMAPRGGDTDYSVYLRLSDYEELNTWLSGGTRANRSKDGYSEAVVLAHSADDVTGITEELQEEGFIAFSSQQILSEINSTFVILQAFVAGIGLVTLTIAGTGIANTLITAIYERTSEIGLMKAVGATEEQVMSVFLAEAGAIGALGGLGGVLIGVAVSFGINILIQQYFLQQLAAQGGGAASGDVVSTPLWLFLIAPAFAAVMGVLAGIYPARRAATLDPGGGAPVGINDNQLITYSFGCALIGIASPILNHRKLLVIEDDPKLAELVRLYLERDGYHVTVTHDGRNGLELARHQRPDLILLDLMLPRLTGTDLCKLLRAESNVPIIMLTAKSTEDDKLAGLDLGADDYITKPFSPREVVARVRALLRRATSNEPAKPAFITIGNIDIDLAAYQARMNGQPLRLTPKEFNLLALMAGQPGRAFTRLELLEEVFGLGYAGMERTVDVHMMNLRKKIEADPAQPNTIETVYGVGYRMKP